MILNKSAVWVSFFLAVAALFAADDEDVPDRTLLSQKAHRTFSLLQLRARYREQLEHYNELQKENNFQGSEFFFG